MNFGPTRSYRDPAVSARCRGQGQAEMGKGWSHHTGIELTTFVLIELLICLVADSLAAPERPWPAWTTILP